MLMRQARDHFVGRADLDAYRQLKPYAERLDEWPPGANTR